MTWYEHAGMIGIIVFAAGCLGITALELWPLVKELVWERVKQMWQ